MSTTTHQPRPTPDSSDTQDQVSRLLPAYFRHVDPDDLAGRSDDDLRAGVASQLALAADRPQGTAAVRVVADGPAGRSVIEVVVDDMPYLVDSVTMELSRLRRDVRLVVHPFLDVVRDVAGRLLSVEPVDDALNQPADGVVRESWMHVETDRVPESEVEDLVADLQAVLRDVRESVEDTAKMHERVADVVADLVSSPPPLSDQEVRRSADLLEWLAADHFTFLGYREYSLEETGTQDLVLRAIPGTGLGILRSDQQVSEAFSRLPDAVRARARDKTLLVLAKANSRATVHRPSYLDYVGVKTFDAAGEVSGERRFLGLFTSAAYAESLTRIPLIGDKAIEVLRASGYDPRSHAGLALLDTLQTYPRDEVFQTPVEQLAPLVEAARAARERRTLRVVVRPDTYGRYVSVLVFLPRDRYNTAVRQRFVDILREQLGGDEVEFNVRLDESTTARIHFVVQLPSGSAAPEVDGPDLERRLTEASRSWREDLVAAIGSSVGADAGAWLATRYADAFPEAYKEDFDAVTAAEDLVRLDALRPGAMDLALRAEAGGGRGEARLKVYRTGEPLVLSDVLPMLASMGLEVVDERPYELHGTPVRMFVYEFGLHYARPVPPEARASFTDALRSVWEGRSEVDGFNALVLAAGLTWPQVWVLRAYAKYMRQGNSPFAQDSIEAALRDNVDLTVALVHLFEKRFDPAFDGERELAEADLERRILAGLDDVASLDHDRILRAYLTHVKATIRTNFFRRDDAGERLPYLSVKLEPSAIPELPQPRPRFEIFVHSPRVEGVHLRFGAVARGGLRWSDRRDDFRTEVLGLVKAQMVKNTVIVPVGAKGGFFAKQLPDASDREAWLAEGTACYRTFIRGLLDLTDNLVDGRTVPPPDVVRHDGDDSYLVVAADKGTATFSDIANALAQDYGFWLGDAFASGGSVGYDHKVMGITARGAWVSVERHFRERGIDCAREDFTCVGVGDMSGDVFGNGMLRSEHTRLLAAFDHRDIFVDPTPDATTSYAERARLFALPGSSWQDYDASLISQGGGVWPRSSKAIPIGGPIREALGLEGDVSSLTPAQLMHAILGAPVDLLWNGGIGTYVKAREESSTEVGDKANDAIRIDGADVRARAIGEGGNLGLTQAGRVEYAHRGAGGRGGRIDTDFIDNSAGVDTSDHEVNIKILLDPLVASGEITLAGRNELLAQMTDEVAALVLRDNYEQNLALANAEDHATSMLHVHEDWMRRLVHEGVLDRELEGLPSSREVRRRLERNRGLTTPELSVLLAWTKIVLAETLLGSDLPDDPYLDIDLRAYFPSALSERFGERIETHPLRRQIIVTQVVNDLVNGAGMTFWPRLAGETGAGPEELTRANFVAREIFGSLPLREELASYDNRLDAGLQTRMRLEMRTLVERASRWLATTRRPPLDSQATVDLFSGPVQATMALLPDLMVGREQAAYLERRDALVAEQVPPPLAARVAALPPAYMLLGVVEIAAREGLEPADVARVHFALGERLGLSLLVQRILGLPREDRWQTMARASLRDDLHAVHAQLTAQVLAASSDQDHAPARVAAWEEGESVMVARATATLQEVCADDSADLARLSVGLRVVRSLLT